ncbi:MAG TPA: 50S ribosomal protein L29 [Anaerolineae bacterium]|nr:50S ribosomal protein L29 [Anaerolineae bacterium]
MKAVEIREMSIDQIKSKLLDTRKENMELRFQVVSGQLTDTSKLQKSRTIIARLETILRERELVEESKGEK